MKKTFMALLAVGMLSSANAQLVEVQSVSQIGTSDEICADVATISDDGSFAVVGSLGGNALWTVDMSTGASRLLTTNGSASEMYISPDGTKVVYRQNSFSKGLRYVSLICCDVATGTTRQLVKPSRRLNSGVAISDAGITAVENGKARVKGFGTAKAMSLPVASISYGSLVITVDGKSTTIDPQGRASYLWPSISPDGSKVVYCLSGVGTYVCNLDGSNARFIGRLHAAKWAGNDMVVGMNDYDNGEYVVSSSIVIANLDGEMQTLTDESVIALYPSASADGKRIAFCDSFGHINLITLK